jgi:GNAT superfamily N-acetyltransferase
VSRDEVRRWEEAQIAFTDLMAYHDGEPAGSVAAGISHARPQSARVHLTVLAARRRNGIGSALYVEISARASAHGATQLLTRIQEREPESIAFAERRGFRVVGRDENLTLDLRELEPPPTDAPPGIEIVQWVERPELARGLHDASFEANPDVPGQEDWAGEPFEIWQKMHRPELMFAAVAGDEVVGFAELFTSDARPGRAYHLMTGVRRAWRGRGIAGALKCAQIAWAKDAGYERLETSNEERNEPIRRLNERLGYRVAGARVEMAGPLAS